MSLACDLTKIIFIKDISRNDFVNFITSYATYKNYDFDIIDDNEEFVKIKFNARYNRIKKNNEIEKITFDVLSYGNANGVYAVISSEKDSQSDSFKFPEVVYFITNLETNYSSKLENKKEITKKVIKEAIKNKTLKENLENYSSFDPEFDENIDLIQKGIYEKGRKKISYITNTNQKLPKTYSVSNNNKNLIYDINGNLKRVAFIKGGNFPKIEYYYEFPQGDLIGIEISLLEQVFLNPQGKEINIQGYLNNLSKEIRKNWKPSEKPFSYSIEFVFWVDNEGKFTDIKVDRSTGGKDAEKEAMKAIEDTHFTKHFPKGFLSDYAQVELKFSYSTFSMNKSQTF